jgi:hypothetical protein
VRVRAADACRVVAVASAIVTRLALTDRPVNEMGMREWRR